MISTTEHLFSRGIEEGNYLFRRYHPDHADEYILSVVFRKLGTHHHVHISPTSGATVNKTGALPGAKSLSQLVAELRTPKRWWPVELKERIEPAAPEAKVRWRWLVK